MRKRFVLALMVMALAVCAFAGCTQERTASDPAVTNEMAIVAAPGYEASAQSLSNLLTDAGVSVQIRDEIPEGGKYRPVLIGPVEQEAAQQEMLKLREKDYSIVYDSAYILIAAGSAQSAEEAVQSFAESAVEYFHSYGDFPFGEEYAVSSVGSYDGTTTKRILFGGVSAHHYVIATKDGQQTEAALLLQTVLKNMAGMELEIVDAASLTDQEYAVVFGSGNDKTAQSLADQLKAEEGWIRQDGNRLQKVRAGIFEYYRA